MSYENPDLVLRYQNKLGLDEQQARQLFDDTKRFLFLCGTMPGKWSPTKIIDEGWHHMILFTQDYADFCQRFFGRFIHHSPHKMATPDRTGSSPAEKDGNSIWGTKPRKYHALDRVQERGGVKC